MLKKMNVLEEAMELRAQVIEQVDNGDEVKADELRSELDKLRQNWPQTTYRIFSDYIRTTERYVNPNHLVIFDSLPWGDDISNKMEEFTSVLTRRCQIDTIVIAETSSAFNEQLVELYKCGWQMTGIELVEEVGCGTHTIFKQYPKFTIRD